MTAFDIDSAKYLPHEQHVMKSRGQRTCDSGGGERQTHSMLPLLRPAIEMRPSAVICRRASESARQLRPSRMAKGKGGKTHVDVGLLGERDRLRRRQAGKGEHADLALDVLPVAGRVVPNEAGIKGVAHLDNPVGHACRR